MGETDTISRQAALDAIMGQPPEPHYPSWYAAQIEKLPSAQPATNCSEIPNGSDDTISRRAAIDALWKALYEYEDETEKQFLESEELDVGEWIGHRIFVQNMNDIDRQTILNLPTAQPEQRWIPVTERLPENDNEVLITVWDAEDDYVEVYKGFYQGHEWWTQWCHGCSKIKGEPCGENIVIAWMPLPEPYRGGET